MKANSTSNIVQAVGLACLPITDMPAGAATARRPVAAAVVTLQMRYDGHREIVAKPLSDARAAEFPPTWLIDQALVRGAHTLISPADRVTLAADAMSRRTMIEPALAALCAGEWAVDPTELPGGRVEDGAALCRRLQIPYPQADDREVERLWNRDHPDAAEEIALGIAVARLLLWAHTAAFSAGEPDAFFETALPIRDWLDHLGDEAPALFRGARARPLARSRDVLRRDLSSVSRGPRWR